MNGVMDIDVDLCRLCGAADGIKFKIFDPGRNYISKIHQLLPIMIHRQDPWPKLICHRCAFKLQEFYDFRELCIQTDCKLKRGGSLPVPKKPWTQQQAPTSWMQITPSSSSPAPSLPSQTVVNIKQEKPDEAGPPMLVPQKPLLQQSPMMQPTQMVHHSPQLMQQQSYESLMQQQQQQQSQIPQQSIIQQQQPQMTPLIQQQGLMQQQQFVARMPVLSHSPHLLMQTHPPTTSSPQQAPQLQQISPMPMVQFNQGNFRIKQQPNDTLQNTSPRTEGVVSFVKRRISSHPNVVFLSSNQDESYLSEGPDDGILNEGNGDADDDGPLKDRSFRDSLGRFLPGSNGSFSGSNKRKNEKTSTAGQEAKSSNSKKRKKGGGDSGYKKRRSSKSKSKAKPDPKSQTNSKSPANTKNAQQVVPNTEISKPRRKPGPKPKTAVEPQNKINDNPNKNINKTIDPASINSNQSITSIKTDSSNKKTSNTKIRKAGPKSRVGSIESDSDSDHSEVSIVLCKPPNSVLDTIDITQGQDTPQESEEEGDPAEGLPSHILLTRIPGICNIYTCTICECTITSKKHVLSHVCQTKPSKEVKLSEPNIHETSSDDRIKTTMNTDRSTVLQETSYKGDSDSGPYTCEVCDAVFTRQVTLMSHKEKHLYAASDEDSDGLVTLNRPKTKKKNSNPIPEYE